MNERSPALFARAALLLVFAVVVARTAWVADDAFISLRTIDNFVHGHGLRWNVAERVCSFTHPLWLFVVSAFYRVTGEAYYTVTALSFGVSFAAFAIAAFAFPVPLRSVIPGLVALILSQAFIDYSTSGLENPLTHLLVVLFALALARERPGLAGWCAGLAVLNRMDLLLLFGPPLAVVALRDGGWRGLRRAAVGFVPFAVWELFSLLYYGSPFPNTATAKLGAGLGLGELAPQGLSYLENSLRNDPLTPFAITLALGLALVRRGPRSLGAAAGIVAYLAYVVSIGGDFMSGRFLSAPFVAAVMLSITVRAPARGWFRPAQALVFVALGMLAPRPTVMSGSDAGLLTAGLVDAHGIADERRFYFPTAGLFNGAPGWTRPVPRATEHARIARRNGSPLMVEGMVGVAGFFAGPGVHVVDLHALGDPLLSRLPVVARDPVYEDFLFDFARLKPERPWRVGHYLRNLPPGYLETVLEGANRIRDPRTAALYDRVALLARAPLWSGERLRLIASALFGGLRDGAAGQRPDYRPIPWDDVIVARPDHPHAYFERGRQLRSEGRPDAAAVAFEYALARDPEHLPALLGLGDVQREIGRPEEAIESWRRALERTPDDAVLHHRIGEALLDLGRAQDALAAFERAVELDPSLPQAYGNLGVALLRLGRFDEALTWLERAAEAAPLVPEAHENLGFTLLKLDRPARALESFERALALEPERASVTFLAANAHTLLGDEDSARRMLERTIEISPRHAEALFVLGRMEFTSGRAAEARELWHRSAELGFEPAAEALAAAGP